jgi:hypothetical protein
MPLVSKWFRDNERLQKSLLSDPAHVVIGDVGPHVTLIQGALIALDGDLISADEFSTETYGKSTAGAVLDYKTRRGIINHSYQTQADNIVGKMTIRSLDDEMLGRERRRASLLLSFKVPTQSTAIIVSQSHPIPSTWASQVAKAQGPFFVKRPSPSGSPEAVIKGLKALVREASGGGALLFSVGHGVIGSGFPTNGGFDMADHNLLRIGGQGSSEDPKTFTNVFYDAPPPPGSTIKFSEKEIDERQHPGGSQRRLKHFALYKELCQAFIDTKLAIVILLTCRVGQSTAFLQRVAQQWATPILAYRDFITYEGAVPKERARAIFDRDKGKFNTRNPGTNTPFAETHIPLSIPDMVLIFP